MIKLIIFLGNPGEEYSNTFHNLGFMVGNEFNVKFKFDKESNSEIAFLDEETILCKPQTFMNLSGQSVKKLQKKYKIMNSNILVVHDDLSVKIGKFRYEPEVQTTMHNGVISILNEICGNDICRIRIGCSRPSDYSGMPAIEYVLMEIPEKIKTEIEKVFPKIKKQMEDWIDARRDCLH